MLSCETDSSKIESNEYSASEESLLMISIVLPVASCTTLSSSLKMGQTRRRTSTFSTGFSLNRVFFRRLLMRVCVQGGKLIGNGQFEFEGWVREIHRRRIAPLLSRSEHGTIRVNEERVSIESRIDEERGSLFSQRLQRLPEMTANFEFELSRSHQVVTHSRKLGHKIQSKDSR